MSTSTSFFTPKTKPYSSSDCSIRDDQVAMIKRDQGTSTKLVKKTLLVIILSAPEHIEKRHALRRTWLSLIDNSYNVKYLFAIGSKAIPDLDLQNLKLEQQHYEDLLLLPEAQEGYSLLTKKLLVSLLWADKNIEFDFLLKVDDDSYINIRHFMIELLKKSDTKLLYWGYFNGRAQVHQKGKWKETGWNLCDRYLPYARGGGYVISRQLVHYLAQNAMLLNIFQNEDVAVGAWLAPLNVTRVHDIRFDTEWASRGCSNQYLITHPQEISEIYKIHEALLSNGRLCQLEFEKRSAYSYDWSVLPSHCCNKLA